MIDKAFALVVALVLGVFSALCTTEAQEVAKVRKVGELHPGTGSAERLAALREAGYVEGQNRSSYAGMQRAASNACRRSQRSWSA